MLLVLLTVAMLAGCSTRLSPAGQDDGAGRALTGGSPKCPTHWHATFALFLPGPAGEPMQVDFAAPKTPDGAFYYDFANQDNAMTLAMHMHQEGAEAGAKELGPTQWHMESPDTCTGVQDALRTVDVEADEGSLRLSGGHAQVEVQHGTFTATPAVPLRWWVQSWDPASCAFTWQERPWTQVAGYQVRDGESLLGAMGDFDVEAVATMQGSIPPPVSRPGIAADC